MFLFLSLALIKRYAELMLLEARPGAAAGRLRGYASGDAQLLLVQGIASGYLAVVLMILYTRAEIGRPLYAGPELPWGAWLMLFYWINYLWLAATRARIAFARSDAGSIFTIGGIALFSLLSL